MGELIGWACVILAATFAVIAITCTVMVFMAFLKRDEVPTVIKNPPPKDSVLSEQDFMSEYWLARTVVDKINKME
jgi:hypothetical protein